MGVFRKKDGEGIRQHFKPTRGSIVEKTKVGFWVVQLFRLSAMTERLPADDFVTADDVLDVDILAMEFQKCTVERSALIARDDCEEPLVVDFVLAIGKRFKRCLLQEFKASRQTWMANRVLDCLVDSR